MEKWRECWRLGFAPVLSLDVLTALREAVATDDVRLTQGSTTTPPPLMCVQDWPVEAGCAIGYCGAVANGGFADGTHMGATVGEAEEYFAKACFDADQRLGEAAACRDFLTWFDDTPRGEVLAELLPEIDRELGRRAAIRPATEARMDVTAPAAAVV